MEYKKGIISSEILLDASKQGRNIVAYIMDTDRKGEKIILDPVDIVNYLAKTVNRSQANTVNVKRGIKNLLDMKILIKTTTENVYIVDTSKILV